MRADVVAEAFVELCREKLPDGTEVFPGPPGKDQPLDQCVWVDEDESTYEPFALGMHPPKENVVLSVTIAVYREGETHQQAQADARARATVLERAITEHVLGDTFDLKATVNSALVTKAKRSYVPADEGWSRRIALTIVATTYP